MRAIVPIMFLLCININHVTAQNTKLAETKKYVLQTFPVEDKSSIVLNIEGQVAVEVWNQTSVCVETSVIPQNANFNIIKMLAKEGYYNVKTSETDYSLTVYNRPASKMFVYKGQKQTVCMEYKVYVPADTQVTDRSGRSLLAVASTD